MERSELVSLLEAHLSHGLSEALSKGTGASDVPALLRTMADCLSSIARELEGRKRSGIPELPAKTTAELGMHMAMEGVRNAQRVRKGGWRTALSSEAFLACLAGRRFGDARWLEEAEPPTESASSRLHGRDRLDGYDPEWTTWGTIATSALLPCLIAWREHDLAQIRLGRDWNSHREGLQSAVEAACSAGACAPRGAA